MRQIFTSQRLETVEGVARLLEEHGIETYTSNRRAYKGNRRAGFSYSTAGQHAQPGVWIVRADDLVRARDLLRRAGLLESTQTGSYLPSAEPSYEPVNARGGPRWAMRVRLGLLAAVTVLAVLSSIRMFGAG